MEFFEKMDKVESLIENLFPLVTIYSEQENFMVNLLKLNVNFEHTKVSEENEIEEDFFENYKKYDGLFLALTFYDRQKVEQLPNVVEEENIITKNGEKLKDCELFYLLQ